jgi:hypothetical protein
MSGSGTCMSATNAVRNVDEPVDPSPLPDAESSSDAVPPHAAAVSAKTTTIDTAHAGRFARTVLRWCT